MLPVWVDPYADKYDITTTFGFHEAEELLAKQAFDLYIFDYLMPEMSGADFCAKVREKDPNTPVIIYTGMGTKDARARCIENGADLFLLKPNDLEIMKASVADLLERRVQHVGSNVHRGAARASAAVHNKGVPMSL
jgi:DNA-binding response OmpR family regulator